jgi:hypothetical protein
VVERSPKHVAVRLALDGPAHFQCHDPWTVKTAVLPIGAVYGHVRLDNTVDSNPFILRRVPFKGDARVSAHKAASAVGANQVLAFPSQVSSYTPTVESESYTFSA